MLCFVNAFMLIRSLLGSSASSERRLGPSGFRNFFGGELVHANP